VPEIVCGTDSMQTTARLRVGHAYSTCPH
jgi:hypothetical protein